MTIEDSTTYYSFSDTEGGRTTASAGDATSINEEDGDLATTSSNATGSDPTTDGLRKARDAPPKRMQVSGHACPTGCGHWCWGTSVRAEVVKPP